MRNASFWDESVEEAMNQNMVIETRFAKPLDSDSQASAVNDTYYARSNIAQLPIHEPSAEELIKRGTKK